MCTCTIQVIVFGMQLWLRLFGKVQNLNYKHGKCIEKIWKLLSKCILKVGHSLRSYCSHTKFIFKDKS